MPELFFEDVVACTIIKIDLKKITSLSLLSELQLRVDNIFICFSMFLET